MRILLPVVLATIAACGVTPNQRVEVRFQGDVAEIVRGDPGDETVLALFRGVRRWAAGDVTGDGRTELVLLWSFPDRPPRVWVVRPEDSGVREVWKGSGMAGTPLDVALGDSGGGAAPMVVLEDWGTGFHLVLYRWDRFGFRGEAWGVVGPGALRDCEDGGFGYLTEGEDEPCPLEIRGRRIRVQCPRR